MDSFTQLDPSKTKILWGSEISIDEYGGLRFIKRLGRNSTCKEVHNSWEKLKESFT